MDIQEIKEFLPKQMMRFANLSPVISGGQAALTQAQELLEGKVRMHHIHEDITFVVGRRNIDWSGGHFNHQEWPTQLGRFFFLQPLMRAYRHQPRTVYAEAARDYIDDWIDHFDCENVELRGNTCMDIGIRLGTHDSGGWVCALATFMDEPSWDDKFVRKMVASIERQAHILWKRGIPSRNWGNHRIFGLDGLLHTVLRLPMLRDAAAIVAFAKRNLEFIFRHEFHADGTYVEQTLGYHQHMAKIYIYLLRLSQEFPELEMTFSSEILRRALIYALHTRAGGINDTPVVCGSCDHEASLQATRATMRQISDDKLEDSWLPARDAVYANAGQVFLRSSWAKDADFLAFDAAVYSGAHAHLARLGLVFRTGGQLWLADPGSFDYEMSDPFAIYGRSTPAHCTLNINGLNQGLGDARLVRSKITDDYALLHGVYDGNYWSGTYKWGFSEGLGVGTYGRHERILLWIRGEYLLVFDLACCEMGLNVEHVWQLAAVDKWHPDAATLGWRGATESGDFHLQMVLAPAATTMTVYEGSREPLRGWLGVKQDAAYLPAPQVVYRYPADCRLHATLAMPLNKNAPPPQVTQLPTTQGRGFVLQWLNGVRDVVALAPSLSMPLGAESPFDTDSPLVWARYSPTGAAHRYIMLDGTYCETNQL